MEPSFGLELMETELYLVQSVIYPNHTKQKITTNTNETTTATVTEPTIEMSKLSTSQVQQLEQAVGYLLHVHHKVHIRISQLAARQPGLQEHVSILNQLLDKIRCFIRSNQKTIELIVVSRSLLINMIKDICKVIY